jgi:hypothetical protein
MTPKALPGELEGDFFRRKARFFLRVTLFAGAAFCILVLTAFVWQRMRGDWPVSILGVPGFMLAAMVILAPIGAWYWLVQSLSRPRSNVNLVLDRLLYASAVFAALAAAAICFYFAYKGFLTGAAVLRRGSASFSTHPILFVVAQLFWVGSGAYLCYATVKHLRMMRREGHLSANHGLQRTAASGRR